MPGALRRPHLDRPPRRWRARLSVGRVPAARLPPARPGDGMPNPRRAVGCVQLGVAVGGGSRSTRSTLSARPTSPSRTRGRRLRRRRRAWSRRPPARTPSGGCTCGWLVVTGARRGEMLALRWNHLDLDAGVMEVRRNYVWGREKDPKHHHMRRLSIDAATVELLREHRAGCEKQFRSSERSSTGPRSCSLPRPTDPGRGIRAR